MVVFQHCHHIEICFIILKISLNIDGYMAQKVSAAFFKTSLFEFSPNQGYLVILQTKKNNTQTHPHTHTQNPPHKQTNKHFVSFNQTKKKSIMASFIKRGKSVAMRQSDVLLLSLIMLNFYIPVFW